MNILYAKQGRTQAFKTKAERDKFLNDEIKSLKAHEKAQQAQVDRLGDEVAAAKKSLDEVVERGASAAKEEEERRESAWKTNEEVQNLKKAQEDLQEQRK